jgi:alpha-1,2-mannosyltransferase
MSNTGRLLWLVIAGALLFHILAVLTPAWLQANKEKHGRDFASFHYAVAVGLDGGDPYDTAELGRESRKDGTRKAVYPYFYPPTFLLIMAWAKPLSLKTAYQVWFWLGELALLLAFLALWRWWRRLGVLVPILLVLILAFLSNIPNNHLMGQANMPVLALVVLALWLDDGHREKQQTWRGIGGGAAMGIACMMKMSPALFVAWWLLRRRWVAAGAACGTAVVATLITLPFVGLEVQQTFYLHVLPGFASGDYNGLNVPLNLFGNHSIPNVTSGIFGPGTLAKVSASAISLGLLAAMAFFFRKEPTDHLARWGQLSAVSAAMLLVPAYTYEHHMIWLAPAAVISVIALAQGRLSQWWAVPIGLALAAWCFELAELKQLWMFLKPRAYPLSVIVPELKFTALLVLFASAFATGVSKPR